MENRISKGCYYFREHEVAEVLSEEGIKATDEHLVEPELMSFKIKVLSRL